MPFVFKLKNPVKQYGWGSPEWIPQLLGLSNDGGKPWAELWMGVHPEGPSELDGNSRSLPELIGQDPVRYLGEETAREFGGLPFLFKLLAAAQPLSIQAHPNLDQAKAGWERENSLGIPPNAPNRNYRDANHKPEIICALSPFTAMAGFREPGEIIKRLDAFGFAPLTPLRSALSGSAEDGSLRHFLDALFSLSPETRQALCEYARRRVLTESTGEYAEEWKYTAQFAELYPGDPAIIAPLYLNLITLKPGEAMNIPAGILHAYVHGFGLELMANSDNVLRGGLTPKHIDLAELTGILRFSPFCPEILQPPRTESPLGVYPSPFREFSLYRMRGRSGDASFPLRSPAILVVLEGELIISTEKLCGELPCTLRLKRGESAFIAPHDPAPVFSGDYTIYIAGLSHRTVLD